MRLKYKSVVLLIGSLFVLITISDMPASTQTIKAVASRPSCIDKNAAKNVDKNAKTPAHRKLGRSRLFGISLDLGKLELSEEQKKKIQDSRKFARLKLHELKQAKIEKTQQLKSMVFDPAVGDAQIRTCGSEIQRLQSTIDNVNLESLIQLRSILTAEQRSKLEQLTNDEGRVASINDSGMINASTP